MRCKIQSVALVLCSSRCLGARPESWSNDSLCLAVEGQTVGSEVDSVGIGLLSTRVDAWLALFPMSAFSSPATTSVGGNSGRRTGGHSVLPAVLSGRGNHGRFRGRGTAAGPDRRNCPASKEVDVVCGPTANNGLGNVVSSCNCSTNGSTNGTSRSCNNGDCTIGLCGDGEGSSPLSNGPKTSSTSAAVSSNGCRIRSCSSNNGSGDSRCNNESSKMVDESRGGISSDSETTGRGGYCPHDSVRNGASCGAKEDTRPTTGATLCTITTGPRDISPPLSDARAANNGGSAFDRCSGCRLTSIQPKGGDAVDTGRTTRITDGEKGGTARGSKGRSSGGLVNVRRSAVVGGGTCEARVKCCSALEGCLEVCEAEANQLFDMTKRYFKPDRYSLLKRKMHDLEKVIRQSIIQDSRLASAPVSFRAQAHLLLGRTLDVLEVYNAAAEETLAKAVKLDPSLRAGWNTLGSVYWKKGSYREARECFQQSIDQCGPCMESLRGLSMALRATQSGSVSERRELVCMSLSKAKEALSMDIADPESWYILGNAYMTHFMECDQTRQHLQKALAAYNHAEESFQKKGQPFPDLYRNRALTYRYVEEYSKAFVDLNKGASLDSESGCREVARQLRQMLTKISSCIQKKYRLKPRELTIVLERLNEDVKTFTNANVHQAATGGLLFKYLVTGQNPSRLLVVKLLAIHSGSKELPV
eukprot:GHVS01026594.1.p1 GENE.GHVS01026594.1~~GHVS01026594.1.p1  ORF type:complete len:701 (-),score=81.93 GHVS01026594.1:391-2493(-)